MWSKHSLTVIRVSHKRDITHTKMNEDNMQNGEQAAQPVEKKEGEMGAEQAPAQEGQTA